MPCEGSMPKSYSANAIADWIPAVATGAAFFMIVLDTSIVNLALASLGAEFRADVTTLQWLVDGYALVFASLLLGAGALGDRLGGKSMLMCGLAMFTLASVLCGIAPDMQALQVSRIVQGAGAALLVPNSLAALNNAYAGSLLRPKAIAAWASSGALGVALGPALGGLLVQALGWRSIFLVNAPVGLLALWLTLRHIPRGPRNQSRGFDAVGQLLAMGMLATATYALINLGHAHSGIISSETAGAVCVSLVIGFIAVEARHSCPMLALPLLRRRTLGPVALVGLLHNVSFFGLIFVLSLSFQHLRGLSPVGAGLMFLPLTVAFATGTRVGALLLRNYGPFLALIRGHFVAAIGCYILASFGQRFTPAALVLPLIVIGGGAGITTPAMNLAVLDSVEPAESGLASGILYSARQTGGVIGVAVLGALLGEPVTSAGAQAAEYTAAGVLCLASCLALAASRDWRVTPAVHPSGYPARGVFITEEQLMSKSIPVEYRDLFNKRAYATLGTLRSDGSPQVTPVWCDIDGDQVLVNTAKDRHQDKNIRHDPRVAVVIVDPDNPYRYLEVRGRAIELDDRDASVHLDQMAAKYLGSETYAYRQPGEIRVLYAIQADRIHAFSFPHAEWLSSW